jgi:hypothetical protein
MFGFLNEIGKAVGAVVGVATGPIIGLSVDLIANTLGMSVSMVKEAIDSGCKTYDEIRDFHR